MSKNAYGVAIAPLSPTNIHVSLVVKNRHRASMMVTGTLASDGYKECE